MLRSTAKFLVAEAGVLALPPTFDKKHSFKSISLVVLYYLDVAAMLICEMVCGHVKFDECPSNARIHVA